MKNFKLLFLFLVILFVSTEAAPKGGRGGGRGYRGGGGYYYPGGGGYYGGGGVGEFPVWAKILICVLSVAITVNVFCTFLYVLYIEENDDCEDKSNVQSEHENKI